MDYLDSLIKICVQRREADLQRWKQAGGTVGLSEWDFLQPIPASTARKPVTMSTDATAPIDEKAGPVKTAPERDAVAAA